MPTPTASDYIAFKRSLAITNDSNANHNRKHSFANTQYNYIPPVITSLKYLPYINKTNIVAAQQLADNVIRMFLDTNYDFSYTYYDFNGNGNIFLNVSPKPYMFIVPSDGQYKLIYNMILPSNFQGIDPPVPSMIPVKVLSTTTPSTFINDTKTTSDNYGVLSLPKTSPDSVGGPILVVNANTDTQFTQGQVLFFMPFAYKQDVDGNPNFNHFRISITKVIPPQTYTFNFDYHIDGILYGKSGSAFSFTAQKTGTYSFMSTTDELDPQGTNGGITQTDLDSINYSVVSSTITSSTLSAFNANAKQNGITVQTYSNSRSATFTAGQTIYFLPIYFQLPRSITLSISFVPPK